MILRPSDLASGLPANAGGPDQLRTSEQAETELKRHYRQLLPGLAPEGARELDALLGREPVPTQMSFQEYRSQIAAITEAPALVHGALSALEQSGRCWVLHYDGLLGAGLEAALDCRSGALLLLWRTPEG